MNIPKAIEILEDILRHVEPGDPPEEHQAVQLGIEALKVIKIWQATLPLDDKQLLPSETEET